MKHLGALGRPWAGRARPPLLAVAAAVALAACLGWGSALRRELARGQLDAALLGAVREGNVAKAEQLLAAGASVEARVGARNGPLGPSEESFTPLALAAERGDIRMVDVLLAHGADVHAVTPRRGPFPARDIIVTNAAQQGGARIVGLLLDRGARVDARGGTGVTPLMLAAQGNHVETAVLLIRRGAAVNARDDRGFTPLQFARGRAGQDRSEIVRLLQRAGAR